MLERASTSFPAANCFARSRLVPTRGNAPLPASEKDVRKSSTRLTGAFTHSTSRAKPSSITSTRSHPEKLKSRSEEWGGQIFTGPACGSEREPCGENRVANPPALSVRDYAKATAPPLRGLGIRILVEPGRFLVGNAGMLLTRVFYIKETG